LGLSRNFRTFSEICAAILGDLLIDGLPAVYSPALWSQPYYSDSPRSSFSEWLHAHPSLEASRPTNKPDVQPITVVLNNLAGSFIVIASDLC